MKLKDGILLHQVAGEYMAVATGEMAKKFNGMVRMNATGQFIFQQLLQDTSEDALVAAMAEKYDAPVEQLQAALTGVLEQLRQAGLLEE